MTRENSREIEQVFLRLGGDRAGAGHRRSARGGDGRALGGARAGPSCAPATLGLGLEEESAISAPSSRRAAAEGAKSFKVVIRCVRWGRILLLPSKHKRSLGSPRMNVCASPQTRLSQLLNLCYGFTTACAAATRHSCAGCCGKGAGKSSAGGRCGVLRYSVCRTNKSGSHATLPTHRRERGNP